MKLVAVLAVLGGAAALPQGTSPASSAASPPPKSTNPFSSLLNALPKFLAASDLANSVANDLVNGTKCKDIVYIVARGSAEPGNIGNC